VASGEKEGGSKVAQSLGSGMGPWRWGKKRAFAVGFYLTQFPFPPSTEKYFASQLQTFQVRFVFTMYATPQTFQVWCRQA